MKMAIQFTYLPDFPRRALADVDLDRCEEFLDVKLPPDFRAFLLAHDGPVPEPAWFSLSTQGTTAWLGPVADFKSTMYSAQTPRGRGNAIESYTSASREGEKLPSHFVAIATMMTQPSTLLISTAPAEYGRIYAWHVSAEPFQPEQLVAVAGSFAEFLGMLTEAPAGVVASYRRQLEERRATRRAAIKPRPRKRNSDRPDARL
jgi:hypothetical protein